MRHWLMKAEPDSRIVKGKDVKFSVDDFEAAKTTPWEGVRNAEARNLMRQMSLGDRVLFYHSNCKNPGIAGFAEVSKEAYPDYTAWDPSHPYYDEKTDKEKPKWYMVDVTFQRRAPNFVSLALVKRIAAAPGPKPPTDVDYIGEDGLKAIKEMALITRGRLSVQPVEEQTFAIIEKLAETGGWGDDTVKGKGKKTGDHAAVSTKSAGKSKKQLDDKLAAASDEGDDESDDKQEAAVDDGKLAKASQKSAGRKRKAVDEAASEPLRRSTRTRK